MLADTGYAEVESFGELLWSAELAEGLAETGLRLPTVHIGLDMVESASEKVIQRAPGTRRPSDLHTSPDA